MSLLASIHFLDLAVHESLRSPVQFLLRLAAQKFGIGSFSSATEKLSDLLIWEFFFVLSCGSSPRFLQSKNNAGFGGVQ